jgi:hypothetical protein
MCTDRVAVNHSTASRTRRLPKAAVVGCALLAMLLDPIGTLKWQINLVTQRAFFQLTWTK